MPRANGLSRDAIKRLVFERHTDWAGIDAALNRHRLVLSRSSLERFFNGNSNSGRTLRIVATLLGTTPDALAVHARTQPLAIIPRSAHGAKFGAEAFRVAYGLWVEMTTRKIGLPIDLERDLVLEVYDSWYAFFKSARDLAKAIPLHEDPTSPDLRQLVALSHAILNQGLRPHLERWQAKFRHWQRNGGDRSQASGLAPQEAQMLFPEWDALCEDLLASNRRLVGHLASLEAMLGYPAGPIEANRVAVRHRLKRRPRPSSSARRG